jgi:hypothetical protein
MGRVSVRIGISVGVAVGGTEVGATAVNVAVTDGSVKGSGGGVGVVKTCTEKVHPALKSAMTTKLVIDPNHLRCFIKFSLSTMANE